MLARLQIVGQLRELAVIEIVVFIFVLIASFISTNGNIGFPVIGIFSVDRRSTHVVVHGVDYAQNFSLAFIGQLMQDSQRGRVVAVVAKVGVENDLDRLCSLCHGGDADQEKKKEGESHKSCGLKRE